MRSGAEAKNKDLYMKINLFVPKMLYYGQKWQDHLTIFKKNKSLIKVTFIILKYNDNRNILIVVKFHNLFLSIVNIEI